MSNSVWCFLVGGAYIFPVNIDRTETVGDLKVGIKTVQRQKLRDIDADDLTLYRVNIKDPRTTVHTIAQFNQFSQSLNEDNALDDMQQLSVAFHGVPPGKPYYVLVQPPKGQSIYSKACCCVVVFMADVVPSLRPCFSREPTGRI